MERVGGGAAPTMDTVGVRPLAIDHIYVSPSLAERLGAARVVRDGLPQRSTGAGVGPLGPPARGR
jgi:hypothetical protein